MLQPVTNVVTLSPVWKTLVMTGAAGRALALTYLIEHKDWELVYNSTILVLTSPAGFGGLYE